MQLDLDDIEGWATEEIGPQDSSGQRRTRKILLRSLVRQVEADRKLPQPSALEPGTAQRQIAEARQRRIKNLAVTLGYKPAEQEIVGEVVKHVAVDALPVAAIVKAGIEATGESGSETDKPGERKKKQKQRESRSKSIGSGRELGLGFGFESS